MKNQLFVVWILLVLQLPFFEASGQIPEAPQSLPGPNAASLGQYGDYPVSHFTGLPQIGIPLYELEEGNLNLPISLSYHASGFRPDQHPGWVGMGWSLNAGGVVTRTVNDMPDEYNNNLLLGANSGFYYNYPILNRSDWNHISYMQTVVEEGDRLKDTEPDEFSFVLPDGTNGKFYLTHTGTWAVRCDRPVSVQLTTTDMLAVPFIPPFSSPFEWAGYFKSFSGFVITDEFGTQYTFGSSNHNVSTNAIEYSMPFFSQNSSHWIATSWHLTGILHPNKDIIEFEYERDSFVAQMYISVKNNLGTSMIATSGWVYVCKRDKHLDIFDSYAGNLVSPVYLKEINAGSRSIKFTRTTTTELRYSNSVFDSKYLDWNGGGGYESFLPFLKSGHDDYYPAILNKLQWKKLDQIRVEEDGMLQKAWNFNYSNSNDERLTLLALTEEGKNGRTGSPYLFDYDNSVALPPYLANMNDHWGFFNGTYANISNQNTYYTAYYEYRNPKASFLLAGTLNRITFPTGGITDFIFEPNDYIMQVHPQRELAPLINQQVSIAGGLRIRKISSYDPLQLDKKVEREYSYNGTPNPSAGGSSGILGGTIKYYFDDYRVKTSTPGIIYSKSIFSSQSVFPGNYSAHGNHIGYSTVFEILNDGSYTRYDYTNYDLLSSRDLPADAILQPLRSIYDFYASRHMNRGKLLKETSYLSSGVPVKERTLTYSQISPAGGGQVRSLKALRADACDGHFVYEATAYRFLTHSYLPVSETVREYDRHGLNPITTTRTITYDSRYGKLISQELLTDSKGVQHRTTYRYPFDVSINASSTNSPLSKPIQTLNNYHIIGRPIEVVTSSLLSTGEIVTSAEVTTFQGENIEATVSPHRKYLLDNNTRILKSAYVPFTADAWSAVEQNILDPNLRPVGEYWFSSLGITLNRVRLTGYRIEGGPWRRYLWGYDGRHITSIIENTHAVFAYTGFESPEKGNWIYSGSSVVDITAPTGSRVYNLSVGAVSKSGLTASNKYLLSYWAKSGSAGSISGGAATAVRDQNGWTLYKRNLTGATSVTLGGNVLVDDVRLHLAESAMTTYTFNKLGSMTTATDEKGDITRYDLDEFNRLEMVRDQNEHLLGSYSYNYGERAYANLSKSIKRQRSCPIGYIGSEVIYTVPPGVYLSTISQADADAQAQADLNANGQAYANANGTCTLIVTPFRVTKDLYWNGRIERMLFWKDGALVSTIVPANTLSTETYEVPPKNYDYVDVHITNPQSVGFTPYLSFVGNGGGPNPCEPLITGSNIYILRLNNVNLTGSVNEFWIGSYCR